MYPPASVGVMPVVGELVLVYVHSTYAPASVGVVPVVGELVLDPRVDLFERHATVRRAADGHLDEVHVRVGRTLVLAAFTVDLRA